MLRSSLRGTFVLVPLCLGPLATRVAAGDLDLVDKLHDPAAVHVDQKELVDLIIAGHPHEAFLEAFEGGDLLFETVFNALDGVGANVGNGQRFTRTPRADLVGPGQWATHIPSRATGPNAESCNSCHLKPSDDGAGPAAGNVHRDPLHSANLGKFIQRNTPHLFAAGGIQRLAEEMNVTLQKLRDDAGAKACQSGQKVTVDLIAKGVNFGKITAIPTGGDPCVKYDTSKVVGVSTDLIVRPFQWKGSVGFLRDFNRGASHNELGMQAVELVGDDVDGDSDGIMNEMTIGDQTAFAVYVGSQPRPTSKVELSFLGLIPPLTGDELLAIARGAKAFADVGCASCHVPELKIDNPIFTEPSQNPNYRDKVFPAGQDPISRLVDPALAVSMDLTKDQPDNQIKDSNGNLLFHLGALTKDSQGRANVDLFGDLKRHDMGTGLRESIDEVGSGASVFLTENLWGVGSTAPYLHDGRATTLTEAILAHGGEATSSKNKFLALTLDSQKDLIAFLDNLVLFKLEEE
jgi:hypothetical protein